MFFGGFQNAKKTGRIKNNLETLGKQIQNDTRQPEGLQKSGGPRAVNSGESQILAQRVGTTRWHNGF